MNILISACLLGIKCRYDCKVKEYPRINDLIGKHTLIPVCPEQLGGMPTPRPPVEIKSGEVVDINGKVYTDIFVEGANAVLQIAKYNDCTLAILKKNSPSCGYGEIYDGSFSGTLIEGNGITAQLLRDNDITVKNEENF